VADDGSRRCAFGTLVDDRRLYVLDQRSAPPDVQRLHAITDAENRLTHGMRILQQQFIEHVPGSIGRGRARISRFAVLLRSMSAGLPGNTMAAHVFTRCAASAGVAEWG